MWLTLVLLGGSAMASQKGRVRGKAPASGKAAIRSDARAMPATAIFGPVPSAAAPAALPNPEDMIAQALGKTVLIEGDGVYGSGIVLVPRRGIILTNLHVVEEMRAPRITYYDGHVGVARVLETDKALDLALLEGSPISGTPSVVGDAIDLRPAQALYAIGSPRKLGFTVSRGIVSYVGRPMDGTRFIQTDLPINEGNSGGPVLTARGEVVGVMSFILRRANGLAFALPINYAIERFADRLPEVAGGDAYLSRFRTWKRK
jgi:S1-C subfamily serine protease